jgi:CRISPR-associated protein Csm5
MSEKYIYKTEEFNIETLAPVHIGTGNKFGNWDFYIKDGKVYIVSLDKLIENLSEKEQEILVSQIENKKSLQDYLSYKEKEYLLSSIEIYNIDLLDLSKKIHGIWEEIKHPKGLYIPASTLKGAIRTAVLYCLLKENRNNYNFSVENGTIVLKDKNGNTLAKGLNEKDKNSIQNFLEIKFFGENQSNDIFKYIKISDSSILENFEKLKCRKVYIANTTQFEKKLPNGKKISKHPEYYETIAEGTEFNKVVISTINEKIIENFINRKYLKTLEKIKNWKQCLYEFSRDLLDTEIKFWKNENVEKMIKQAYSNSPHSYIIQSFNKDEVIQHLEQIKEENTLEEPVIRLGKLTGYLTHSIGMLLADNPEKPYDISKFGKIINTRAKNWLFPLTRRLTLDNQTLGWCKIKNKKNKGKSNNNELSERKEKIEKVDEEVLKKLAEKLGGRFRK